ncbi:hypothetical protein [Streptomyces sp. NPDC002845]
MTARNAELAAAVELMGALPMPVGPEPSPWASVQTALFRALDTVDQLRARLAELEVEAAAQRRTGYQVAIEVMRQEKLPMSVELLEAQLELEKLDVPEATKRPAGSYPPALPWAALMDDEDLEEFLADLTASVVGYDGAAALAEIEATCGRWRLIAETQHAHNTAPGPSVEVSADKPHPFEHEYQGESDAKRRLPDCKTCGRTASDPAHDEDVTPQVQQLRALLAGQRAAVEDPHDSPLHHDYRVPRDLPETGGA